MPVVNGTWIIPDKANVGWAIDLPKPIKVGRGEDAWKKKDIKEMVNKPVYNINTVTGIAMDIEQHAVEVSGEAEKALASLKAALDKFKSTLANDLTSIKAAATRIQSETTQMKQAYQAAQIILTTPEFEHAVNNAERMAIALKAISELSNTKLSVAVFNNNPQ